MPLRALFNPSVYGNLNITTARVYLPSTTRLGSKKGSRAHSTAALTLSPSWTWTPPTPSSCCPSHSPTPKPFNQDHVYWRHHAPRLRQSLLDKFHEIEQLYRGNVEYVRRMGKENPGLLEGLAFQGQKPPFMIVDCSDSRVNEQGIFDAEPGTMFTAGNIANMFDEADTSSYVFPPLFLTPRPSYLTPRPSYLTPRPSYLTPRPSYLTLYPSPSALLDLNELMLTWTTRIGMRY
ncbi:hypothetical protein NMY22_g15262 [Coprinellus aureogranulatus]|nr:hypothetical protein NMY22_g15262 [Coprinellus aureogranulatus]